MAEGLKIWGVSNYILILMKQGLLLNLPNYGGAIAPPPALGSTGPGNYLSN